MEIIEKYQTVLHGIHKLYADAIRRSGRKQWSEIANCMAGSARAMAEEIVWTPEERACTSLREQEGSDLEVYECTRQRLRVLGQDNAAFLDVAVKTSRGTFHISIRCKIALYDAIVDE